MSIFSIGSQILMQVPPEYRARLLKGTLKLTGSVLRDTRTGRIVGFLQEASPLAKHLARPLDRALKVSVATGNPGAGALAAVADLAMQAGQLVQGEAIRAGVGRIEGGVGRLEEGMAVADGKLDGIGAALEQAGQGLELLKNAGVANLALGAAGIGVSVVGFGIMAAKLDTVLNAIHSMSDQLGTISARIDRVRQDMIDADFLEVHSLCRLYEEGWEFGDRGRSEQQWLRIAHEARTLQDRFAFRARELLAAPEHIHLADPMLDATALASGLRVASLVACNEKDLATSVAAEAAMQVEALTGSIGLVELAAAEFPAELDAGSSEYDLALTQAREAARPRLRKIRDREAATATRAAPLPLLEARGISPREWLEAARNEKDAPLLVLLPDEDTVGEVAPAPAT